MITIDHEPGYAPMIFITGADTFKCDPAYYLGTAGRNNIPPNYPMPAVRDYAFMPTHEPRWLIDYLFWRRRR